ncbi:MAG TPA: hypothetical protein VLH15_10675 [Dehalococcoidales bacterium]|nr:hypothetical protein [Dehalococcoidales bacterium]
MSGFGDVVFGLLIELVLFCFIGIRTNMFMNSQFAIEFRDYLYRIFTGGCMNNPNSH